MGIGGRALAFLKAAYSDVSCEVKGVNYGDFIGHFDDLVENLTIELHQWIYVYYSILNWIYTILHLWGVNWAISKVSTEGKTRWANLKLCIDDRMDLKVAIKLLLNEPTEFLQSDLVQPEKETKCVCLKKIRCVHTFLNKEQGW